MSKNIAMFMQILVIIVNYHHFTNIYYLLKQFLDTTTDNVFAVPSFMFIVAVVPS